MNTIKIVYNSKIEDAFHEFNYFISDTLFSNVVSKAMYTNLNILVYCPRKEVINKNLYNDLTSRIDLIHKDNDNGKILEKFFKQNKEKKINKSFINKYLSYLHTDSSIKIIRKEFKLKNLV